MVLRAQEHELAHTTGPFLRVLIGLMQGTARDQPAHAVRDEVDRLQRHGPSPYQCVHQGGEFTSVRGDVATAVVVQVDRRDTQIAGQRGAEIGAVALPLQVAHAQAVYQHHDPAAGVRQRFGEGQRVELERGTVCADAS